MDNDREEKALTFAQLSLLPDEAVMAHLRHRNGDALAVLFHRYQRLVFSIAIKVLRDVAEAEDTTQSVFLELYKSASSYDAARGSAKTWVLKFAYHLSLNRRRHLATRNRFAAEPVQELEDLVPLLSPGDLTYPEKKHLIEEALSQLNDRQRNVLQLAFFEGLTLKEIAECLDENVGNVRHHYYRGLDKLREQLSSSFQPQIIYARKEISDAKA